MRSFENISSEFEKIILKGLELTETNTQIKLFHSTISIYKMEDTIFVYHQHLNSFSNKTVVSLYEIKSAEIYYLFDTCKSIIEDADEFGTEASKQDAIKIFSSVIDFCKKTGFEYKDFEIAISKMKK